MKFVEIEDDMLILDKHKATELMKKNTEKVVLAFSINNDVSDSDIAKLSRETTDEIHKLVQHDLKIIMDELAEDTLQIIINKILSKGD